MGCTSCSGCSKGKSNEITQLSIEKRSKLIREITEEIDELIGRGIDSEEILNKILNLEKILKLLRNQVLEKYLNEKVSLNIQQGDLEKLEDLMLYIKKID